MKKYTEIGIYRDIYRDTETLPNTDIEWEKVSYQKKLIVVLFKI